MPTNVRCVALLMLGLGTSTAHAKSPAGAAEEWDRLRSEAGELAALARTSFGEDGASVRARLAEAQGALEQRARAMEDRGLVVDGLEDRLAYARGLVERIAAHEAEITAFEKLLVCVEADAQEAKAALARWERSNPSRGGQAREQSALADLLVERLHDVRGDVEKGVVSADRASRESIRFKEGTAAIFGIEASGAGEVAPAANASVQGSASEKLFTDVWAALEHATAVLDSRLSIDELVDVLEQIRDADPVPYL